MPKTMLYKAGGPHKIHGQMLSYIITEDIEGALKDGWVLTTPECAEKPKKRTLKTPKTTGKVTKKAARKAVKKVSK